MESMEREIMNLRTENSFLKKEIRDMQIDKEGIIEEYKTMRVKSDIQQREIDTMKEIISKQQ
jgi:hypothetical protein